MQCIILFIAPPHNTHLHWPWLFNLGSYRSKHLRMQNERHHSCVIPHNACWAMGDQWRESALAPLAWHVRSDMICPNVTWIWNETRQASDLTLLRLYLVSCMPDLGLSFLAVRLLDRPFILSDDIPVRSTFTTPQYRLVQNMLFELRIETKLGLHVSHEHQHIRVDIISEIKGGPNAKRAQSQFIRHLSALANANVSYLDRGSQCMLYLNLCRARHMQIRVFRGSQHSAEISALSSTGAVCRGKWL